MIVLNKILTVEATVIRTVPEKDGGGKGRGSLSEPNNRIWLGAVALSELSWVIAGIQRADGGGRQCLRSIRKLTGVHFGAGSALPQWRVGGVRPTM